MDVQNQIIYQHFQQTINEMERRRSSLTNDIKTVEEQLVSMKKELENLNLSIVSHQGGMSTIELLTNNNLALVTNPTEQPLTLNQFSPPSQPSVPQQQYAQQPTNQAVPPPQPITEHAQQAFAPTQYPSPGDIAAAQGIHGPQIVQGQPPSSME